MPRTLLVVCSLIAMLVTIAVAPVAAHPPSGPTNPGFEQDGAPVQRASGWRSSGARSADFTEAGGHNSGFRLAHSADHPYSVETTQKVKGLGGGWHTLRIWVQRSVGQNDAWVGLEDCGGRASRAAVPVSPGAWVQIVVSAHVRRGSCTIVLHTDAAAGEWTHFDDVELVRGAARLSILGGDVSSLNKSEDVGGVYRTESGRRRDALAILEDHGLNWIRLRAWVDPADGYHDTAELLTMAKRAKKLGLKVLVDLHYSDFWADPGKQWTPASWEGKTFPELKQSFVDYTRGVVQALKAQGTPPDMIQLGNEINPGLLWDYAATWTGCSTADDGYGTGTTLTVCHTENWDNLAELLTAGYEAVKSVSPRTRVMLHLAEGGSNGTFQWWFDNVTTRGVPFDVIGASYYGYWHGSLADLQFNLNDVSARYDKDVVVAETAYAFTLDDKDGWSNIIGDPSLLVAGYPATPAGQAANLRDVMSIVRAVPDGRGLGVFYWDPTWTGVAGNGWTPRDPASGNAWENQALFGYDDRPLPAMDEFVP
jgi:arabinogalactan endo-1,4-beta-galactosidase